MNQRAYTSGYVKTASGEPLWRKVRNFLSSRPRIPAPTPNEMLGHAIRSNRAYRKEQGGYPMTLTPRTPGVAGNPTLESYVGNRADGVGFGDRDFTAMDDDTKQQYEGALNAVRQRRGLPTLRFRGEEGLTGTGHSGEYNFRDSELLYEPDLGSFLHEGVHALDHKSYPTSRDKVRDMARLAGYYSPRTLRVKADMELPAMAMQSSLGPPMLSNDEARRRPAQALVERHLPMKPVTGPAEQHARENVERTNAFMEAIRHGNQASPEARHYLGRMRAEQDPQGDMGYRPLAPVNPAAWKKAYEQYRANPTQAPRRWHTRPPIGATAIWKPEVNTSQAQVTPEE